MGGEEYSHWFHLHIKVVASYCQVVGAYDLPITRACETSAVYAGNPAGSMTPLGDPLTFGLPWEADGDVRLRTVITGETISIQAYNDATGGDNRSYHYRLDVTSSLKQVLS
jgi:hypothetical protein